MREKNEEEKIRLMMLIAEALQHIDTHLSNIADLMLERNNHGYRSNDRPRA